MCRSAFAGATFFASWFSVCLLANGVVVRPFFGSVWGRRAWPSWREGVGLRKQGGTSSFRGFFLLFGYIASRFCMDFLFISRSIHVVDADARHCQMANEKNNMFAGRPTL